MSDYTTFAGQIPQLYERCMGPMLFEPYARDVATRLPAGAQRVLEVAAGTGRATRHLVAALPADGALVATDLNEPMIVEGQRRVADPRVRWQVADAMALPFEAASFDAVVCQFGLMFVPDQVGALREMRRVLRPGGTALVTTWDALAKNPASHLLHELAIAETPDNPPAFMQRPFTLHDPAQLRDFARAAGFATANVETVAQTGESPSAAELATGFVRGNPLWNQLVERAVDVEAFEQRVAAALAQRFGDQPNRSPLSAHVLIATV